MTMQFKHAIFDMDGTLVDSMKFWDAVCGEFLRELGVYSEEVFDILKPMTVPQTADYLKSAFGIECDPQDMVDEMCRIMQSHYENDVQPKPGVYAFLEAVHQKGIPMCVASSTPVYLIEICLQRLKLRHFFDFLVSAEEVGKGKDDPGIYLETAKRLNACPQSTMVFEDAIIAGVTAKSAGFQTAAIFDETSETEWDAFRKETDFAFRDWHEALQAFK